jgi:hypothetical protein
MVDLGSFFDKKSEYVVSGHSNPSYHEGNPSPSDYDGTYGTAGKSPMVAFLETSERGQNEQREIISDTVIPNRVEWSEQDPHGDPGTIRFIRAERTGHGWEFWERSVWETEWHRTEPTDELLKKAIEMSKHAT